jgi:pimeloyl-ACP methyl ester carboxylesterase
LTLHYQDTGAGEPLVLIPGLSMDHTAFDPTLMAERISGARVTVVPGVGHAAGWEDTDSFNNAVIAFLAAFAGTAGR